MTCDPLNIMADFNKKSGRRNSQNVSHLSFIQISQARNIFTGPRILHGSTSACIDPEVKRSRVKGRRVMTRAAALGLHVDTTALVSSYDSNLVDTVVIVIITYVRGIH